MPEIQLDARVRWEMWNGRAWVPVPEGYDTSADLSVQYRRARDSDQQQESREPTERRRIDANELERIAKERPDEYFLKGSGVLKLIGGIRQLEAEIRHLREHSARDLEPVGGFRHHEYGGWQQVATEYEGEPDVTTLYRDRNQVVVEREDGNGG